MSLAVLGLILTATVAQAPTDASATTAAKPAPGPSIKRPTPSSASSLLRPAGSRPYDEVDWNALPPWRKTSFFGIRAQGQTFIFVVDCSGSMGDDLRLMRAKDEIRRSVGAMRWPQKFLVIFYNDRPLPMPGGLPEAAEMESKLRLAQWFRLVEAEGETDPREAMTQALSLRPDAVFLLSDGAFPHGTVDAIAGKNPRKTPIHCIDLAGGAAGDQLKRIAEQSGGRYVARP